MKNIKKIKDLLKKRLPDSQVKILGNWQVLIKSYFHSNNLSKLAQIHHSDKWGKHFYTPHYENHFEYLRNKKIDVLEIGIGAYRNTYGGGASLRMWESYFRKANIYGIDLYDKSFLNRGRIKTFQGDQSDPEFLKTVIDKIGNIDIIVDDGSHINSNIIKSFEYLLPYVKNGGWYVVEDLQTSYWPSYGGSSENLGDFPSAINYFKKLIHGLNHKEFMLADYKPTFFDLNITEIHFYHNMVFIKKNKNEEPSNYLLNNKIPQNDQ